MYIHIYICIYDVHVYTYAHAMWSFVAVICMFICVSRYLCTHVSSCTYVYLFVYIYIHTRIWHVYIHMYPFTFLALSHIFVYHWFSICISLSTFTYPSHLNYSNVYICRYCFKSSLVLSNPVQFTSMSLSAVHIYIYIIHMYIYVWTYYIQYLCLKFWISSPKLVCSGEIRSYFPNRSNWFHPRVIFTAWAIEIAHSKGKDFDAAGFLIKNWSILMSFAFESLKYHKNEVKACKFNRCLLATADMSTSCPPRQSLELHT